MISYRQIPFYSFGRALWRTWREPPGSVPQSLFDRRGSGALLRGTGFHKDEVNRHPLLRHGAELLVHICQSTNAKVTAEGDLLSIVIDQLKLEVTTVEELFIIREVYAHRCYDISINQACVVIDIGMNVAFTALRFASRADVKAVFSYEPFEPTYRQALRNIASNSVGTKIQAQNYGLGAAARELLARFDPYHKGQSRAEPEPSATDIGQRIQIKPVSEAMDEIRQHSNGLPMIAKIDCEGAEYEIVPALAACGAFQHIHAFAIEWHRAGPEPLREILAAHGYRTLCTAPDAPFAGMIYAFR